MFKKGGEQPKNALNIQTKRCITLKCATSYQNVSKKTLNSLSHDSASCEQLPLINFFLVFYCQMNHFRAKLSRSKTTDYLSRPKDRI